MAIQYCKMRTHFGFYSSTCMPKNAIYHKSKHQIEGAFYVVANTILGRCWKPFKPNSLIDDYTLLAMTNLVRTRNYMEDLALNEIFEELMKSVGGSITYSNDGSALNKVESNIVQSVVTESHESLKDLDITTLKILSAATGYKFTEQEILSKINLIMTDSTAHNIGVI